MNNILKERATKVEDAYRLLQGNKDGLGNIPGILRQLVSLKVWEGYDWRGKTVTFGTFREFVETPPPEGLGTTVAELVSFCKNYPEIADEIDRIIQEQSTEYHPPKDAHGIQEKRPTENSLQRSLRRLRNLAKNDSKAATLRSQVLRGEISANYALRELGKRKTRYSVDTTPENLATFAKKHLTKTQIKQLIEELEK